MITCSINKQLKDSVPHFKVGLITYNDITIDQSPKMLKGRFQMFQEELMLSLTDKPLTELPGISEWRQTFRALGMDPSRYRPSQEALFRRIKKGNPLPSINSAVDINNLTSLQYQIPLGIYDVNKLNGDIEIAIGSREDEYEAISGRLTSLEGKLHSHDELGPFGSPIVDSLRSMVTEDTKQALHIIYLRPSLDSSEAPKLLHAISDLFTTIHGGEAEILVVE